jgi:hypothetical protein
MDTVEKAQREANESAGVKEAAKKVNDAAAELVAAPNDEGRKTALDSAVHAHATAMSDALIRALLKVGGGRKTRRGKKSRRSTRKSRR